MEQFDEHVKQFNMERFASQRAAFLDSRIEAEREFDREHSRIQRVLTDKKKLRMGPKCLPVEDRSMAHQTRVDCLPLVSRHLPIHRRRQDQIKMVYAQVQGQGPQEP